MPQTIEFALPSGSILPVNPVQQTSRWYRVAVLGYLRCHSGAA